MSRETFYKKRCLLVVSKLWSAKEVLAMEKDIKNLTRQAELQERYLQFGSVRKSDDVTGRLDDEILDKLER